MVKDLSTSNYKLCDRCDGSGEGRADGSRCPRCNGTGSINLGTNSAVDRRSVRDSYENIKRPKATN